MPMNLLSEPSSVLNFLYVFEGGKLVSYNPLTLGTQKVPSGFYLIQGFDRKGDQTVYELVPNDKSSVSLLDIHYVEQQNLNFAFKEGDVTFTAQEGEA